MIGYGSVARVAAVAAGVLGLFGTVSAVPAAADVHPPLSIGVGCIAQGDSVMECIVNISGGVAPYAIHWSTTKDTSDDVTFGCFGGHLGSVFVTVTDSQQTQVSATRGYNCLGGPPR